MDRTRLGNWASFKKGEISEKKQTTDYRKRKTLLEVKGIRVFAKMI